MAEMTASEADKFNALWKAKPELTAQEAIDVFDMGPYAEITLPGELGHKIQRVIEQQAAEIERLRDLHRSILWFVEEHKKIPNCKKWMPLIKGKARQGVEKEAEVPG